MASSTTRVTLSLPDDLAVELTALSAVLGVSRSAFLSAYLAGRIRKLRLVAEEFADLQPADPGPARRYRGEGAEDILQLAEHLAGLAEQRADEDALIDEAVSRG